MAEPKESVTKLANNEEKEEKHWIQQSQSWRKILVRGAVMRLGESGARMWL